MKTYDELGHLKRNGFMAAIAVPMHLAFPISLTASACRGREAPASLLLRVLQRVDACTDLQGWAQLHVHCTHEMVFF